MSPLGNELALRNRSCNQNAKPSFGNSPSSWPIALGQAVASGRRAREAARAARVTFRKVKSEMKNNLSWIALIVAGVALLIAAIGAILALFAGHARFIEVAWVSIAASLFVLAWASLERPLS